MYLSLKFLLPSPLGYVCFHFVKVSQQLKAVGTLGANHVILAFFVNPGRVFRGVIRCHCRGSGSFEIRSGSFEVRSGSFEIRSGIFPWLRVIVTGKLLNCFKFGAWEEKGSLLF